MDGSDIWVNFEVCIINGTWYYCYGTIWTVKNFKFELSNPEDRFAVAVCKCKITVGYMPKRI